MSKISRKGADEPNFNAIMRCLVDQCSDEYCPHCDNHFIIEAVEPQAALQIESGDTRLDSRSVPLMRRFLIVTNWVFRMLKDDRIREESQRTMFDVKDAPDRLG